MVNKQEHITLLAQLSEVEFTELILMPLLSAAGYKEIRNLHGPDENGKDLVFQSYDSLRGDIHYAGVVKSKKITGDVSTNRSAREIVYQARQAMAQPFLNPTNGRKVFVDHTSIFLSRPISQKALVSIEKELSPAGSGVHIVDAPKIVELIHKYDPNIIASAPSPERRYIQSISARIRRQTSVQRFGGRPDFDISNMYINGRARPIEKATARLLSFGNPIYKDQENIDLADVINKDECLILVADLGAGKTSAMHNLVLRSNPSQIGSEKIPIFVPLHLLPASRLVDFSSFLSAISKLLDEEGYSEFSKIEASKYTLLLDGYDELKSSHSEIARHVQQLREEKAMQVVLTTRPSRVPDIEGFKYFHLLALSDDDIERYLDFWFEKNSNTRVSITNMLHNAPSIRSLCRTPLFLMMYCIIASTNSGVELPTRRTDIYAKIADLFLGGWDQSKQIENTVPVVVKSKTLEMLAYSLQIRTRREFDAFELEVIGREVIAKIRGVEPYEVDGESLQALRNELVYRSSLIRETSRSRSNEMQFSHLSFQEFFAARHMNTENIPASNRILFDDWWRNVFIFYFGIRESMGDIHFPGQSRMKDKSIRLMEYLFEARFTDSRQRQRIFASVAKGLLCERSDLDAYVRACAPLGKSFLNVLQREASNRADYRSIRNFLVFICLSGESAFNGYFEFKSEEYFILGLAGVMEVIELALKLVRTREHVTKIRRVLVSHEIAHLVDNIDALKKAKILDVQMRCKSLIETNVQLSKEDRSYLIQMLPIADRNISRRL